MRTSNTKKVSWVVEKAKEPQLKNYRYQGSRADTQEESQAWGYISNESSHYEFPR